MTRPRALLITPILPSRTGNGLAMRVALFAEAMERVADLDIVVVPIAGHPVGATPAVGPGTTISIVEPALDRVYALLSRIPGDANRLAAFRHYGKPSLCRLLAPRVLDDVGALAAAKPYDLVHIARSYMMPVADVIDENVRLSLDLDEDDHASIMSLSQRARRGGDALRADWLAIEAGAFDRLVAHYQHRARETFISNHADRASLMARHPGLVPKTVVNAVALPRTVERRHDGTTIAFVGTLGFEPNVDGLTWFAGSVLPRLRTRSSRATKVLIAGASPAPAVMALGRRPGIDILANVPHVAPIYRRATIAIAPMRTGGGLRTKIVEAAAHGVACVAHRAATQGLPTGIGWVAASAAEFADACEEALADAAKRARYEAVAARHARVHYGRDRVIARLAADMAALIDSPEREARPSMLLRQPAVSSRTSSSQAWSLDDQSDDEDNHGRPHSL